jgi:hypothetical protein
MRFINTRESVKGVYSLGSLFYRILMLVFSNYRHAPLDFQFVTLIIDICFSSILATYI